MAYLFFSRYHIITAKDLSDKIDFLLTGLRNDAMVEHREFHFKFFNSEVVTFQGNTFITGHLVKYNPDDIEQVVDESTNKIRDEDVKNKVIGKSRYIIDPASSIIMYTEIVNVISKETFIKRFVDLFEKNHDNFFTEISISPIKEQYSFVERLKTFKVVKKISILLFPSNPNFADRWKAVDQRLRVNHISKYKEVQENKVPGQNLIVDHQTEDKFLMSEDGYGESRASGIDEFGNEKTISTKDTNKHVNEIIPFELDGKIIEILETVVNTLQEIIKRTSK